MVGKGAELADSAGFFSATVFFSLHLDDKNLSIMLFRIGHWDKCFQRVGRTGFDWLCPGQSSVVLKGWRGGWQGELGAACRRVTSTLSVLIPEQVLPGASLVMGYLVLCLAPLSLSLDVLSLAGASDRTQRLPDFQSLQNVFHHAYV